MNKNACPTIDLSALRSAQIGINMNSITQKNGGVPRLAMINDIAGFGRCSTAVSLPVISVMQVQVCPVPTSILSNHLAFSPCHFFDYTPHMQEYLGCWKALSLTFDGLYCGFLGNARQIDVVEGFLNDFRPPVFVLDPVLGDHGKAYSTMTEEHCRRMRKLMRRAHILTPNITEACLLTGTPYRESGWTDQELEQLCRRLISFPEQKLVITGLSNRATFLNYIWEGGMRSTCEAPSTGASRPGTGDLFASILAADAVKGVDFASSVRKAADFVALCIGGSEEAGIPVKEGVLFEKYLNRLCPPLPTR